MTHCYNLNMNNLEKPIKINYRVLLEVNNLLHSQLKLLHTDERLQLRASLLERPLRSATSSICLPEFISSGQVRELLGIAFL